MRKVWALAVALAGCGRIGFSSGADVDAGTSYPDVIRADRPEGYWRLNDTGATAVDQMGAHDGAYTGDIARGVPGATADGDGAVRFNQRTTTANMQVPDAPALRLAGSKSLELWVNPNAFTDQGTYPNLLSKGAGAAGYLLYLGSPTMIAYRENSGTAQVSWNSAPIDGAAWNHIVFTYDEATTQNAFYVNGVRSDAGLRSWGSNTNTSPLAIGNIRSVDEGTTSSIDEVAVYAYALTEAQVLAHLAAARP